MLRELRVQEEQKAPEGRFRPVALLSNVPHQIWEDVDTSAEAERICTAYSRGNSTFVYDDHGHRLFFKTQPKN